MRLAYLFVHITIFGKYLRQVKTVLFEDYRLIVERRFARPSDPESYAGGGASFW
jgi:hypothetical protein